jgi:L-fuconolactonase
VLLPPQLRSVAGPLGVRGAIAIESSERFDDNQWLLDLAATDPFVLGVVGNLHAGKPGFARRLADASRDARFLGIRVGTPWCPLQLANKRQIADLEILAQANLTLDVVTVGGGGVPLLADVLALTARIPALRIVIDHLPFGVASEQRADYAYALGELSGRSNVFAKISNVLPRSGPIPADPAAYRPMLDELLETFGPARVLYASNWPVSTRVAPYERALAIVRAYFTERGPQDAERFFTTNVRAAYRLPAPSTTR